MLYDEDELINRAHIAYRKAGENQQPQAGGEVRELDGIPHVVLSNINGTLAVYQYKGDALKRLESWPESMN
jgi:hypothetical protein